MGIIDSDEIPEYVEYQEGTDEAADLEMTDTVLDSYVEGARIDLVSTLCAGNQVTAYLSVSPVTADMASMTGAEHDTLDSFADWEIAERFEVAENVAFDGYQFHTEQVEYDPDTQTALVRMELMGEVVSQTDVVSLGLGWFHQTGEETEYKYYGAVTIPVTPSEKVAYIGQGRFAVLSFENPHDQKHFSIKRTIEWEARDAERGAWRDEMAGLFSQVK